MLGCMVLLLAMRRKHRSQCARLDSMLCCATRVLLGRMVGCVKQHQVVGWAYPASSCCLLAQPRSTILEMLVGPYVCCGSC